MKKHKYLMPKSFRWVHKLREKIDAARIYGYPSRRRDHLMKRASGFLGRIFNIRAFRPNIGKSYGRDYGPRQDPLDSERIKQIRKR